jgi:hypothetical protein
MSHIKDLPDPTRHNMYYAVHKGLRRSQCSLLAAIGATDFSDVAAADRVIADIRSFLALAKSHLDSENNVIHAAVRQRAPAATQHADEDHDDHARSFTEIESILRTIEDSPASDRDGAARALHLRYALFVADDLRHMHEEETELLGHMHALFNDDELREIEGDIIAKIAPASMMGFLRSIIPALSHPERVGMLSQMKQAMPPEVFAGILTSAAQSELSGTEFNALSKALSMRKAA